MLRRFTNVASKFSFIRTYSSASRRAFFEKFVVHDISDNDFKPVVKGMRKYFPKAEDEKDKKWKKKKDVGNEMTKAVDPTMKNENHSKVCGSGGLLLQAPEVLDITNPQWYQSIGMAMKKELQESIQRQLCGRREKSVLEPSHNTKQAHPKKNTLHMLEKGAYKAELSYKASCNRSCGRKNDGQ
ncbi:hypothetical protein Tco_0103821 [Tanacetum coccineum]